MRRETQGARGHHEFHFSYDNDDVDDGDNGARPVEITEKARPAANLLENTDAFAALSIC